MQRTVSLRQRQLASFVGILQDIESDTFYADIALWSLLPTARCEELLGDLKEEYALRVKVDARDALAWYRSQVVRTIGNFLWDKLKRITAIASMLHSVAGRLKR